MDDSQACKDDAAREKEISDMHTSYMNKLHEWQKICNFHYAMCWQVYGAEMIRLRQTQSPANVSRVNAVPPDPANGTRSPAGQTGLPPSPRTEFKPALISYRICAEVIDFFILMTLKVLGIMLYTKLTGESVDSLSYQILFSDDFIEEDVTVDDLRYMMVLGLFYRLLACFYEATFVALGGATPGKMLLGLEVVSCQACVSMQRGNRKVLIVHPGGCPSLASSWIRSMIKNFSITFLMPAFLTVFFYQHNRTSYDIVANTLVVRAGGL